MVIADARTYLAFALAGVPGGGAETPEEARRLLAQARGRAQVGVILITQRLAQLIKAEVDAAREEGTPPLIVEIPDLDGPVEEAHTLAERLRRVMGVARGVGVSSEQ